MKKLLFVLTSLLLVGVIVAYIAYQNIFSDNIAGNESVELFIPSNSSYSDVRELLQKNNIISNTSSFDRVAGWMKYKKEKVPGGYYILDGSLSNKAIISKLRGGLQTPTNLILNNARTLEEMAGEMSKFIEPDSTEILRYLNNPEVQKQYGYNADNFMTMFIPNTYEVFWNTATSTLVERLKKEHDKFWNNSNRLEKAASLNMSPNEVYILASIVEKESAYKPERPTIASLYLNRLKRGILLQADPTVVYANRDFTIRRVLNKHLEKDSPYNTYKYGGLPPGPIGMASINAIDAVLNPASTNYLYMCAKPGYGSEHAFARTLAEHNRNANIYRRWLSKEGIK